MRRLVAIYARQSVEKTDSLSIEGQIDLCKKQTDDDVKIYKDIGFSAKTTNRPAFIKLMQDVEHGSIEKIIVYKLDRFSRSTADFGQLWRTLQAHQVEFVSVNEAFDTSTPIGRAMLNIIMVFAQLERETTAERIRDNYYQRVSLGAWPGGPAPFGFRIGRTTDPSGKHLPCLVPDEAKLLIIQEIFNRYISPTESLGSLARFLNAAKIKAPKRDTWDNVALSRLLHNPVYTVADAEIYLYFLSKGVTCHPSIERFDGTHAGFLVGKRSKHSESSTAQVQFTIANHEGIISSALWLCCQHKLEQNAQLKQTGKGKHTWLSGLLKCKDCGYSVKVNKVKEKYYLLCSGRSNLQSCNSSIRVDLKQLESITENTLVKIIAQCPPISLRSNEMDDTNHALLMQIDAKIERLLSALTESTQLSMQYINQELARLHDAREILIRERETQAQKAKAQYRVLDFPSLAFEEKKIVAKRFIHHIALSEDSAEIIWNI